MSTYAQAIRAVGAVFMQRTLRRFAIIVIAIGVILYVLMALLATRFSPWFWLAMIVLVPLTVVLLVLFAIVHLITKKVLPRRLTVAERRQITGVSDKLASIVETARTPYPIALFMIAKDVVRRRDSDFLYRITNDSKTIRGDIKDLRKLFK